MKIVLYLQAPLCAESQYFHSTPPRPLDIDCDRFNYPPSRVLHLMASVCAEPPFSSYLFGSAKLIVNLPRSLDIDWERVKYLHDC